MKARKEPRPYFVTVKELNRQRAIAEPFFVPKADLTEYLVPAVIGHSGASHDTLAYQNSVPKTEQKPLPFGGEAESVVDLPAVSLPHETINKIVPRLRMLRRVLERLPQRVVMCENYATTYVVETLECGHKLTFYPQADALTAKRRCCVECANLTLASPKKLPQQQAIQRKRRA